ncbi:YheC/YheD family protein [Anaerobacillus arseniciselenatis]|nr:YheC/YheD family protein [Anaerobacillus arseniciselenatis]
MMFTRKVIVQTDKNSIFKNSDHIKIARALCKKWALNDGENLFLQFGNQIEEVCIIETPVYKIPTIEITPDLAKKLAIPFEIFPIHCLYKQEENTLKLGPIISCVTNQMYHEEEKFSSMTPFFEEMAQFAKQNHIFFFINPLIEWDGQFEGYVFDSGKWIASSLPIPEAVYNRIGSRHFETTEPFKQLSTFLQEENIPYFNHCFLDKWETHNTLISYPEMHPYLPNTTLFDDYETFIEKLTVNKCIFLKPVFGSQGRQILRIEADKNRYVVYYSAFSQEVRTLFRSSYLLYQRLCDRLNNQPFIIQEGIDLIPIDDCPLDFRILCIKNSDQKWKVVSSVARISPKERIVSNIAKGGEQKRPIEVLSQLFDEKLAYQYVKLMGELAVEAATLISDRYDELFGELGVDIALDKDGKLWIIEVNSKPSKSDEVTSRIRPSTRAVIAYLSYLSGYPLK